MKNLLIVESPAKCKTIQKILWEDFYITASYGHIIDLEKKWLGVDTNNNFKPNYIISPDKKQTVTELKKLAKKAEKVRIATDEDREGEAIWRHIANALWLDISTTPRIVFHEITKDALTSAIKKPRLLNTDLVNAQQARRILDRLVWFELSPVLRKKVKYGLSAGRVQSVALKIIVEREREIQEFVAKYSFKTIGEFTNNKNSFNAELQKTLTNKHEAMNLVKECSEDQFVVEQIEKKSAKKSPSAPFTTSSLQQEASRKLWYSVSYTMRIAQKLYEEWHITYMRTDSTLMSNDARNVAIQEITKRYWSDYTKPRQYETKSNSAQEAHECIRPTNFSQDHILGDDQHQKLYSLIRKRSIASQMEAAQIEKTIVKVKGEKYWHLFQVEWEVTKFDWFTAVYEEGNKETVKLPHLEPWQQVKIMRITAVQTYERHPPRYTEASLVKKLESEGIGRPSTYAPTIATIQKRNYVVLQDKEGHAEKIDVIERNGENITEKKQEKIMWAEKKKLFPTDIGMMVTDFLQKSFPEIVNYHFTATVEKEFDLIAQWKLKRVKMLQLFYEPFHKTVELVTETSERETKEKTLGIDPKTKKTIVARIGKYGPLIQLGDSSDEEKKFVPIKPPHTIENLTLENALEYLALPKTIGEYKKMTMTINTGRFWPYIKWGDMFISIKKLENNKNRQDITPQEAKVLVQEKIKKDKENTLKQRNKNNEKIVIKKWRWWLFIQKWKKNIRIPKQYQEKAEKIKSASECIEFIQELQKR